MPEDRVDIEMKMAFLERTIEELHVVVLEQGRIMDQMQRQLVELESRVKQGIGDLGQDVGPHDEKPPHY